jgi:CSLREA domain-containing protein
LRARAGVVLAAWIALVWAPHASSATFTVTRTDDPVPGACDSDCSLREAVRAADAGSGSDTIVLPAGHFRLGIAGVGEDAAAKGDLDLTKSVTITGAGARATVVDAMGIDRVFDVASGTTVLISDLTVTGGTVDGDGGGIQNAGTLTLVHDAVVGNRIPGTNSGGGISSPGPSLTITQSTVAWNHGYNGGGIAFAHTLTVSDSTIAGNVAGGPGLNGNGGGISGSGSSTLVVGSSTIADNQAYNGSGSGGGISTPSLTIKNSIVADNVSYLPNLSAAYADNCSATSVTSQGHNLSDGIDCSLGGAADQQGADPRLGPLTANGGPTDTEALPAGSPAIDHGAECPATDQRGVSRPRGNACDIGAYEFAPPLATTAPASSVAFGEATLNGTVDPSARETTARFEYGPTTSYGSTVALGIVGSGIGPVRISAALVGLRQGVTYHYRLVATNAEGTNAGADQTFTTLDKTKPVLSLLRVLPGLFHRGNGATISFRLSEPATVTFRVDRVLHGVKRHGSCVVRKRRRHGRACTRYVPVPGNFAQEGVEGANSFHFDTHVAGRELFPGAYRLRGRPRDGAGNVGKTAFAAFRVLR